MPEATLCAVVWLALGAAQAAPAKAPVPKPVATSLVDVWSKKHRAGNRVEFPAVMLPRTVVQATSGARATYYGLLVNRDSPHFDGIAAVAQSLEENGEARVHDLESAITGDDPWRRAVGVFDGLMKRAGDALQIAAGETVALELSGFEPLAKAYTWKTVVEKNPRTFTPLAMPRSLFPERHLTVDSLRKRLKEMAGKRPPGLDQSLPSYEGTLDRSSGTQMDEHAAMVAEFNAELLRRRRYTAQLAREEMMIAKARFRRMVALADQPVVATVITPAPLAVETFMEIHKEVPPVFVREASSARGAVAKPYFATASVLITSYPTGAKLTLNGQEVGVTPHLVADQPVGTPLAIALVLEGFAPLQRSEKVEATPDFVRRIDSVLEPQP